jgi:hypothetical protein
MPEGKYSLIVIRIKRLEPRIIGLIIIVGVEV